MSFNLLVFATALCLSAWHQPAPDPEGLLRREQQRVDYLVAGKLDQFAEMLSPTLTYTHSSGVTDGKDKLLGDLRSGRVVYRSLKHHDVQVRFPTPDVAILNGQSDAEVVIAGQAQSVPLRFTIVYVKKNGDWLMEAWHSARRPATPTPVQPTASSVDVGRLDPLAAESHPGTLVPADASAAFHFSVTHRVSHLPDREAGLHGPLPG